MPQSELFDLVDCVPSPIFVMDVLPDGRTVYAHYNKSALLRLRRPLSDFIGRTTGEAFGEEYGAAAMEEQCLTVQQAKLRRYDFELPIDDEVRIVRTSLCPQKDAAGKVVRLIGSSQDVSAEWLAKSVSSQLQTISTDVEQFINMAAHDLRAPMRNVTMLAELLRDGFEDQGDGKMELIDLLDQTASKAMSLISDVLSHASAMNAASAATLFSLEDLARDVHDVLDPKGQHSLQCAPLTLNADKTIFQIVLRNLVDNAIKHGGRDTLQLLCTARPVHGEMIELTLSDDGSGFDNPGMLFLETGNFRVDSGYGLLGIRRLILARGGEISAFNCAETGGSTVRMTLPGTAIVQGESVVPLRRARDASQPRVPLKRRAP